MAEKIIQEWIDLVAKPVPWASNRSDLGLPSMIYVGDGQSIVVSPEIDQLIQTIADQMRQSDAARSTQTTVAEWSATVRNAFGPALARLTFQESIEANAAALLSDVESALTEEVANYGLQEIAFGCSLFDNPKVAPFQIGPVCFESVPDWISRKHCEKAISTVAARRLNRAFAGQRLRKRQDSRDYGIETAMLGMVRVSPHICSITIDGMGQEAGRRTALTAARLATTSIALLWQTPSKALEGINVQFDRAPHTRKILTFASNGAVGSSSSRSHLLHGPRVETLEWEKLLLQWQDYFQVIAEILEYVVSPAGGGERPMMMNTLTQALLWFHEACRETVNLMAIVKFATTLDALACGQRAHGIRRLINARLEIQDTDPIRQNGPSLKQAIEKVYAYGRSRTLHGSNDKLGHDWTETRSLSEEFAKGCLLACIHWAARNKYCNDPHQLSVPS